MYCGIIHYPAWGLRVSDSLSVGMIEARDWSILPQSQALVPTINMDLKEQKWGTHDGQFFQASLHFLPGKQSRESLA